MFSSLMPAVCAPAVIEAAIAVIIKKFLVFIVFYVFQSLSDRKDTKKK